VVFTILTSFRGDETSAGFPAGAATSTGFVAGGARPHDNTATIVVADIQNP
jgi:hypothetical protein